MGWAWPILQHLTAQGREEQQVCASGMVLGFFSVQEQGEKFPLLNAVSLPHKEQRDTHHI